MDDRIIQLLTVADTPEAQSHILVYFEQLKKQEEGWKLCGNILAKNLYKDERVKFFCLQVLEAHIKNRYMSFPDDEKLLLRSYLQEWYQQCCLMEHKTFVKNKSAQILCLLFVQTYPKEWLNFFSNMTNLLDKGELAVDAYLRNLIAIDEEVVARHIPHTPQELQRNTDIKDHMRDHCIRDLVESWYQILKLYENKNTELVCLCLQVIGAYVSWIDIDLIANDKFVSCILAYLSAQELRETAGQCLLEIINKGMEAGPKTRLVESLAEVLEKTGILTCTYQDEDIDFVIKLSSLLNGMGVQLITSFNKLTKAEAVNGLKLEIIKAINKKVPHMLRFLADEDDDVSEAVFEFCHAYLGIMKQLKNELIEDNNRIKNVLLVVIQKMKIDEEFDFDEEADEEAEFIEFRKQMKVLLTNIAKLEGELVMNTINELVTSKLSSWQTQPMLEVELAIHVLYCLAEAFPGLQLYNDADKFEKFQRMLSLLITSDVSSHQHAAIRLQYFEAVTRYERYFYSNTHHIPTTLISFLDERGLRSNNASVSSRTSFLLMRFIKALKNQIQPYVDEILKKLQGLLVNAGNQVNGFRSNISENDRYYLYEIAAMLITCSNGTSEKQRLIMQTLLAPILVNFKEGLEKISSGGLDDVSTQSLAMELHHLMAYASRASKAFNTVQSLKQSGCAPCFTEVLNLFLHALTIPVYRDVLHTAVRQYLHRMIICLGEEVLPYIPIAVTHLLKDCEMRDIQEFIPLINQLISRFKAVILPFLSSILMPLVTQIFNLLQSPIDVNDQQTLKEKQLLQRSYFLFLTTIVNANLMNVLTSQDSGNFKEILMSVVHGAVEIRDPQGQKNCFVIFSKLVEAWGGDESFKEFIYDSILPACFLAPLKPTFDLNDSQTCLVLQEVANTQKSVLEKRGDESLQWLQQSYLPQNNCPQEIIHEYTHALHTMNRKTFANFLKAFYARWKT